MKCPNCESEAYQVDGISTDLDEIKKQPIICYDCQNSGIVSEWIDN